MMDEKTTQRGRERGCRGSSSSTHHMHCGEELTFGLPRRAGLKCFLAAPHLTDSPLVTIQLQPLEHGRVHALPRLDCDFGGLGVDSPHRDVYRRHGVAPPLLLSCGLSRLSRGLLRLSRGLLRKLAFLGLDFIGSHFG